ncbi:hypothetical protein [Lysinibacillus sp. FSL K6-3209]
MVDYEFKNDNNQVVLLLTIPVQAIPEIVRSLAQNNIGIYEVSKFNA